MPLERIECRSDQSVVMIVRSNALLGDAMLFHVDAGLPVERLCIPMREILGMIRRVGRDMLSEGEADRLVVAEEAAEGITHAPNVA